MNSFEAASEIEAKSWEILRPFIEFRAYNGRFVRTVKGRLAKELQKSVGDVLYNSDDATVHAVEIKAEQKWTGRLFLERWSNRSRFTPGWIETLNCDLLLCHFLDQDRLLALNFPNLRKWLYHCDRWQKPKASLYPQTSQTAYAQLNDTWGYVVPVSDLPREVLQGEYRPLFMQRQTDMFGAA